MESGFKGTCMAMIVSERAFACPKERLRGNACVRKSSCVAKLMFETQSISQELEEFWTWGGSLSLWVTALSELSELPKNKR